MLLLEEAICAYDLFYENSVQCYLASVVSKLKNVDTTIGSHLVMVDSW